MSALDAVFWVTCLVLVVAGASKLVEPAGTAAALRALLAGSGGATAAVAPGAGEGAARAVGAVEVVLGLAGLVVGGTWIAIGVALAYAAFAVVVAVARRRGLPSCGCFGARSAPPSVVHVGVNVASAVVAAAAALTSPLPVADGLSGQGATGVVVAGLVLLAALLVVVVDTELADLVEATRSVREQAAGSGS